MIPSLFIITGSHGAGKSTLLTNIIQQLTHVNIRGTIQKAVFSDNHQQGYDVHLFLDSSKEIYPLLRRNPEYWENNTIDVNKKYTGVSRPKIPRWNFIDESFKKVETKLAKMEDVKKETVWIMDELGWLEAEGKGYWNVFMSSFQKHKKSIRVWILSVRKGLAEYFADEVKKISKCKLCVIDLDVEKDGTEFISQIKQELQI